MLITYDASQKNPTAIKTTFIFEIRQLLQKQKLF